MFSSCSVKCSVEMTFLCFITCYKYSKRILKRDFTKPSFKHAKIIFLSVAFLYSLSIVSTSCSVYKYGTLLKRDGIIKAILLLLLFVVVVVVINSPSIGKPRIEWNKVNC